MTIARVMEVTREKVRDQGTAQPLQGTQHSNIPRRRTSAHDVDDSQGGDSGYSLLPYKVCSAMTYCLFVTECTSTRSTVWDIQDW